MAVRHIQQTFRRPGTMSALTRESEIAYHGADVVVYQESRGRLEARVSPYPAFTATIIGVQGVGHQCARTAEVHGDGWPVPK